MSVTVRSICQLLRDVNPATTRKENRHKRISIRDNQKVVVGGGLEQTLLILVDDLDRMQGPSLFVFTIERSTF
jgi:hypothetical protein